MPAFYVHLSGGDVRKKILMKSGMLPEAEQETGPKPLEAVRCPRCKAMNPPGSVACSKCSLILDAKYALNLLEKKSNQI